MILHGADGKWTEEFIDLEYDIELVIHKLHEEKLDEYVDLESYHHGELEVMADFRRTLLNKKW